MSTKKTGTEVKSLDRAIADLRRDRERREKTYRERALKIYPWICAWCGREFTGKRLRELTVHHKDQDHNNNPPDGSNWELLCIYCHEAEHRRYLDGAGRGAEQASGEKSSQATYRPFENLGALLKRKP